MGSEGKQITEMAELREAAAALDFERAARFRDQIAQLRRSVLELLLIFVFILVPTVIVAGVDEVAERTLKTFAEKVVPDRVSPLPAL